MLSWIRQHQVKFYLLAFLLGALLGLSNDSLASQLTSTVEPSLGLLLYAMFCQVTFSKVRDSFRSLRFIICLLLLNFVLLPILVWGMVSFLPSDLSLRIGVYLVLLTPCIDYVIFFTAMGQGDEQILLVNTPLLLILQALLLPLYLWLFIGQQAVAIFSAWPFLEAFVWVIALPLLLAVITEISAQVSHVVQRWLRIVNWLPIPFMALVLLLVAASEIGEAYNQYQVILPVVPVYIVFMVAMLGLGWAVAKLMKLSVKHTRSLIFSGGTRNSLVVLALALALPEQHKNIAVAAIAIQTMVEILGELVYVRLIPVLIKTRFMYNKN